MTNIKELLPIGTVVMLNNGQKRLMITGVKQVNGGADGDSKEYDYIGVLYPEGHIGEKFQYLFNHGDINKTYFRGYEDEERMSFMLRLSAFYDFRNAPEEDAKAAEAEKADVE